PRARARRKSVAGRARASRFRRNRRLDRPSVPARSSPCRFCTGKMQAACQRRAGGRGRSGRTPGSGGSRAIPLVRAMRAAARSRSPRRHARERDLRLPPGGKRLPPAAGPCPRNPRKTALSARAPQLARRLHWRLRGQATRQDARRGKNMKLQPFADHLAVLRLCEQRHRVLSSNIANADTPHYKARDIDFAAALTHASLETPRLGRTNGRHLAGTSDGTPRAALGWRIPTQPSLDGNTVEPAVEQAAYAENAVRYRAALSFLDSSIRTLRYAIRGGE